MPIFIKENMPMRVLLSLVAMFWLTASQFCWATSPTSDEMAEARRWTTLKFEGINESKSSEPSAIVVFFVHIGRQVVDGIAENMGLQTHEPQA
jgi:hypothetical protein